MHSQDLSPEQRQLILDLGILVQEAALKQVEADTLRRTLRAAAVDLIRSEVLSQARAARICEVTRATIQSWMDKEPWPAKYDTRD